VGNFLASGVSAIDPQAWLDALAKRGVTFGQFLQMVEPRQAQRLSNLAQQAGEAGQAARKALETPLTQMLDFRRGIADQAAEKMMGGYVGAIQKLTTAWTSFIETLDKAGVIDKVANALTSLGTALAHVFQGKASLSEWGISLAAAVPLIAPLATGIAGLAFAFKGLAAAISFAGAALIKLPLAGIASAIGALGGGTTTAVGAGSLAGLLGAGALVTLNQASKEYAGMTLGERLRAQRGGKSVAETIRDALDERDSAGKAGAHTAQSFGDKLLAELRRVEAEVRASVSRMIQSLNFSASPSITPKIAPAPSGSATPMRGIAPATSPSPTRTAARGLYADYDNGGDLDWV
jgi:phage tail tape-measure protein